MDERTTADSDLSTGGASGYSPAMPVITDSQDLAAFEGRPFCWEKYGACKEFLDIISGKGLVVYQSRALSDFVPHTADETRQLRRILPPTSLVSQST